MCRTRIDFLDSSLLADDRYMARETMTALFVTCCNCVANVYVLYKTGDCLRVCKYSEPCESPVRKQYYRMSILAIVSNNTLTENLTWAFSKNTQKKQKTQILGKNSCKTVGRTNTPKKNAQNRAIDHLSKIPCPRTHEPGSQRQRKTNDATPPVESWIRILRRSFNLVVREDVFKKAQ